MFQKDVIYVNEDSYTNAFYISRFKFIFHSIDIDETRVNKGSWGHSTVSKVVKASGDHVFKSRCRRPSSNVRLGRWVDTERSLAGPGEPAAQGPWGNPCAPKGGT